MHIISYALLNKLQWPKFLTSLSLSRSYIFIVRGAITVVLVSGSGYLFAGFGYQVIL